MGFFSSIGTGIAQAGLGALFGGKGGKKQAKTDKRRERVLDQILLGLQGQGPYADLFRADEEAFQTSFVDPAKARFRTQIAPQIQQSFIASGQQRGTGLDDQLLRAGVDLDQLLNEQYAGFQQGALDRQLQALGLEVGTSVPGGEPKKSFGSAFSEALGGFATSEDFGTLLKDQFGRVGKRRGFEE